MKRTKKVNWGNALLALTVKNSPSNRQNIGWVTSAGTGYIIFISFHYSWILYVGSSYVLLYQGYERYAFS